MGACPGVPTRQPRRTRHISRCALIRCACVTIVACGLGGAVVFGRYPVAGVCNAYRGGRLLDWAIRGVHAAVGDGGVHAHMVGTALPTAYIPIVTIVVAIATPGGLGMVTSSCRKIAGVHRAY